MASKTLLSYEQFLQLPDQDGVRHELDAGELITVASATPEHGLVRGETEGLLRGFVRQARLGVVIAEADFRLATDIVRTPDVAYLSAARWAQLDRKRTPIEGAPDLAIEVVSPSNTAMEMNHKRLQYLRAGALEVWFLYIEDREIHLSRTGDSRIYSQGETLASALLPSFAVPVEAFFAGLDEGQ